MALPFHALVVIPTHNEYENIGPLLLAIFKLKLDLSVLVVDDHSTDGTAEIVLGLQSRYRHGLYLLRRPKREGLGRAYVAGFTWALVRDYDLICSMDADFSHMPADLPRLLTCALHRADVAIGSRYIPGGRIVNWPRSRIWLSLVANWIARFITRIPVQDATAGFVCYRRVILKQLMLQPIVSLSYGFQVEMKFLAHQYGAHLQEFPITFVNRKYGQSKMNLTTAASSFWHLIQMKWRTGKK